MPDIPEFENQVQPHMVGVPDYSAGAIGQPGAEVARGAGDVQSIMAEFNQRYQNARRSADSASRLANLSQQLGDAQHKWSLISDRQAALAGFREDSQKLIALSLKDINDPLERTMFQGEADNQAAQRAIDTGDAAFRLEASRHRGDIDTNLATYAEEIARLPPGSKALQDQFTRNANATIDAGVAGGWLAPEEAADRKLKWASDVDVVAAREMMNKARATQNAAAARAAANYISDPNNFTHMLPTEREVIEQRADVLANSLETLSIERANRADALRDRAHLKEQNQYAFKLMEDVYLGKHAPYTFAEVAQLAEADMISPTGMNALLAGSERYNKGQDDAKTLMHHWDLVNRGLATQQDVLDWVNAREVTTATAVHMQAIVQQMGPTGNRVQQGLYRVLQSHLDNAMAAENRMGGITNTAHTNAEAAYGYWEEHVLRQHEDPTKVLTDILAQTDRGALPTFLPPMFNGAHPHTAKDLVAAATALVNAHNDPNSGMTDGNYQSQVSLLRMFSEMLPAKEQALLPAPMRVHPPSMAGMGAAPAAPPSATPAAPTRAAAPAPTAAPAPAAAAPAAAPAPTAAPAAATAAPAAAPAPAAKATPAPAPTHAPVEVQAHEAAPPPPPRSAGPPPPPPNLGPPQVPSSAVANLPPTMANKKPRNERDLSAAENALEILHNSGAITREKYDTEKAILQKYAEVIRPGTAATTAKEVTTRPFRDIPPMFNGATPQTEYQFRQVETALDTERRALGEEVYQQQRDLLDEFKRAAGIGGAVVAPEEK